jgi:hypothetical protein
MKICRISILGIALLAGCTPEVAQWTPAESPKINKVDRAVFTYIFPYAAHKGVMSPLEKAKFLEFLKDKVPSPYAVRITLEEFGGHSDKRLMDIERELLKYGVPSDLLHRNFDHVDEQFTEYHYNKHNAHNRCFNWKIQHKAQTRGSVVVIVVERFVVIPPSCSNFSQQIGNASQAYGPSDLGCSTELNLGLMIANPQDLLRGRDRGLYDGAVLAAGVNRYEHDKIKEIAKITTTTMQNPVISVGGTAGGASGGSAAGGY